MLDGQTRDDGFSRQRLLRALIAAGVLPGVAPLEAAAEMFEPLALAAGGPGAVLPGLLDDRLPDVEEDRLDPWHTAS